MKALKPTFEDKPLEPSSAAEAEPLFPMPAEDHHGSATLFAGDDLAKADPGWQANLDFGQTIGVDVAPDMGQRYEIQGEIAHGGMGVVFRGIDREMGRPVAIKILREKHQGKPELIQRFIEEAQVTGQLQHPGVVPVYEIGYLPGKLPYFTMRLIEGKTLEALMRECRSEPVLADASRHRLLKIFGQVAQTLAYAHARGVIHRDIKPHNIMVGNFGEILVMDWGLAKVMTPTLWARMPLVESTFAGCIQTVRSKPGESSGSAMHTKVGSIIGTPAYMAPEQARGELAKTDCRADVFGLGAILCEILTGKPPFPGATGVESCEKACRADLKETYERLETCGADAGWIVLAHECLSVDPEFRPADASQVAARVSAYFADLDARVKRAEQERARAEIESREVDKRRYQSHRWYAAIAVLAVLLGGGAAVGMYLANGRALELAELREKHAVDTGRLEQQLVERKRVVGVALAQLASYRDLAQFPQARATLEQAELLAGTPVPPEFSELFVRMRRELDSVSELETLRLRQASGRDGAWDDAATDAAYAQIFRSIGFGADDQPPGAVADRIRGSGIAMVAKEVLDEWFPMVRDPLRRQWMRQVRAGVNGTSDWTPLWDIMERGETAGLADVAIRTRSASIRQLVASADYLVRHGKPDDALRILRAAHARKPGDFWVNGRLGGMLRDTQPEEAVGFCRVAVAIRPTSALAHDLLGSALDKAGRGEEGRAEAKRAIALRHGTAEVRLEEAREALRRNPEDVVAHFDLAGALIIKGRPEEAMEAIGKALVLFPDAPRLHFQKGNVLGAMGLHADAVAAYRRALELKEEQPSAWINMAVALSHAGDHAGALAALEKGLAQGRSGNPDWIYGVEWLDSFRLMAAVEDRLPAILAGTYVPKENKETGAAAKLLCQRGHPDAGLRLYGLALERPGAGVEGVGDSQFQMRYEAACAAVQSSREAVGAQAVLRRKKAFAWLQQSMATVIRRIKDGGDRQEDGFAHLRHWQEDRDLAPVRDQDALKTLPADERAEWTAFWASVNRLLH